MNDIPAEGPRREVQLGATHLTLLGTAHVSRASADEVRRLVASGDYDAVAVELCNGRYQAMMDPDAMSRMDLFQVIREGKAGMVAASLVLSSYQQRLAEQFGVEPGAEMKAAIDGARERDLPLWLVDREVGLTLKRTYRNVPWWQRLGLVSGLFLSLFSRERITEEDIERLKQGDLLESTFSEFAAQSRAIYEPMIAERDQYMALRLREELLGQRYRNALVVVGAGHLDGLARALTEPAPADIGVEKQLLENVPESGRLLRALPWVIAIVILTGFALGFARSPELGTQMVTDWVLINGTLSALGAALAWAHPGTVVGSFFAAPLTSLNPTVGAGFVAAAIELFFRRPRVADFSSLRQDVSKAAGWWHNRVARTLLVFIFVTLGSAAGTYVGGFRVFERLIGS